MANGWKYQYKDTRPKRKTTLNEIIFCFIVVYIVFGEHLCSHTSSPSSSPSSYYYNKQSRDESLDHALEAAKKGDVDKALIWSDKAKEAQDRMEHH